MELSETARRIRAAMVYGGYKGRDALAEAVEVSPSTLQRIEGVAEPSRSPKRSELLAIAEACGVPMWFLEDGWDGWADEVQEAALKVAPAAKSPMQVAEEAVALVRGPGSPSPQRRTGS